VLPLRAPEKEFLDRLLDYGEIKAALLTSDESLADRIASHPGVQWKAINVQEHIKPSSAREALAVPGPETADKLRDIAKHLAAEGRQRWGLPKT
jgi:hypothetical protein